MTSITLQREDFHDRLTKAYNFVEDKSIIPMYQSFRFRVRGDLMEITAANPAQNISVWCKCKSTEDIDFCVDAELIKKTVSTYRADLIMMNISPADKKTKIEIKNGRSKCVITSDMDPKFFTTINLGEAKYEMTIHQRMLVSAFKVSKNFVKKAGDDNSPFSTIGMSMLGDKIVFYASTSAALSRMLVRPISINDWANICIPITSVPGIQSSLRESGEVTLVTDGKRLKVFTVSDDNDNFEIISTLFDGKFPDAEKFFSVTYPARYMFNVSDLSDATKRSKLFNGVDNEFPVVTLRTSQQNNQEVLVVSSDVNTGKSSEEVISVTNVDSSILEKSMNANILVDVLNQCDTGEVAVSFDPSHNLKGGGSLVCIKPRVENEADDILSFLIATTK